MRVRFYFDLVCPYSYLESHALESAEDQRAVVVDWLPLELRPAPKPLLEPRGDHLRTDWTAHVYRRALELGIEMFLGGQAETEIGDQTPCRRNVEHARHRLGIEDRHPAHADAVGACMAGHIHAVEAALSSRDARDNQAAAQARYGGRRLMAEALP